MAACGAHHGRVPTVSGFLFVGLSVRHLATSVSWYEALLGLERVRYQPEQAGSLGKALLRDPRSGVWLGLSAHPADDGSPFSEFRTGLDHVELGVDSRAKLEAWVARLDALGIAHSGIKERELGDLVTFRDPDTIQLEFFAAKGSAERAVGGSADARPSE